MDFNYVPESPGYEDPTEPTKKISVCYMDIVLSELGS